MLLERKGFEGARSEIVLRWRVMLISLADKADDPNCGMQVPTKVPVKLALLRFKEQVLVVRVKFESDVTSRPPSTADHCPRMANVRLLLNTFLPAER